MLKFVRTVWLFVLCCWPFCTLIGYHITRVVLKYKKKRFKNNDGFDINDDKNNDLMLHGQSIFPDNPEDVQRTMKEKQTTLDSSKEKRLKL